MHNNTYTRTLNFSCFFLLLLFSFTYTCTHKHTKTIATCGQRLKHCRMWLLSSPLLFCIFSWFFFFFWSWLLSFLFFFYLFCCLPETATQQGGALLTQPCAPPGEIKSNRHGNHGTCSQVQLHQVFFFCLFFSFFFSCARENTTARCDTECESPGRMPKL